MLKRDKNDTDYRVMGSKTSVTNGTPEALVQLIQ